jgi:hypothetical protein
MSLLELFCHVDDFCRVYESQVQPLLLVDGLAEAGSGSRRRRRKGNLCLSEVMTLCIHFHQSHYRDFKHYYQEHVQVHLRSEFPNLVSYSRFVELMTRAVTPLTVYLTCCYGECSGISFIDSTSLAVCRQQRGRTNQVFAGLAARSKTSMGWFYGFKLHLVVNDEGEILACKLTPGDVDDRMPVPQLAKRLFGKLFGDKGYLSQKLSAQLRIKPGVELLTFLRRNMKGRLLRYADVLLLRKRAIIETIHDQLKNISQIEHTRHRSPTNFVVNLLSGLIAYCHQPRKPSLHLRSKPALQAA